MGAETLRRAAALIQERAEAATEGPWFQGIAADGSPRIHSEALLAGGEEWTDVAVPVCANGDAAHIASWHPAVALAVADWLAECARLWEYGDVGPLMWKQANAVARAYLGGDDSA